MGSASQRSQVVNEPVELPFMGRQLTTTSDFNPHTHIAVGVDLGVTQAIKAGHAQRHPVTGQVLRQWERELTRGQLKHDSGLTKAKRDIARCLHAHILARKATKDALWEEYLKPRWRRQQLGLHRAQERVVQGMKWVSRQHYDEERGVAVFLGAGNFSQGGWKAGAVREGFRKVVQQPSRPIMDDRPDRLVIVDEFRTSRVSSSVHARQPCELHLPPDRPRPADWVPPAGQVNQRLVRPACSLRHAEYMRGLQWCHEVSPNPPPPPPAQDQPPAQAPPGPVQRPQALPWGRWLDRDTNGAFVLPLGLYGSQVWGTACLGDDVQLSNPVQTRMLSFLRFAARVRSSVSGLMVLHELGQLPLQLYWLRAACKF
ncbi:hypothetical protein QJQ45_016331 [Haematococcus lacustris]|nr:hypothetical protein QJQ45_016331 [Haematococcus lacustris]